MDLNLKSEGDLNTTPEREKYINEHVSEETRYWLEEDAKYFLHQSLSTPCLDVLSHATGTKIINFEGKVFYDFHGNNVHHVGFSNPEVVEAIIRQLGSLSFCTRRYTNIPAIELAKKLTSLVPGLNKVLFAPSGSLAIGMAVKLARMVTGKFKTLSMWDSFHGASLDAISLGGEAIFRNEIGPLLPGTEHVPPPDAHNCIWDCKGSCTLRCADYIEYVFEKEGDIGAVVAETVRSTPFIPPKEYWQKVRNVCDKYGALLILDEIPHGLGRTGTMFTFEQFGIVPDIVVIGKALGGGIFPWAAVLTKATFNEKVKSRAIGHYTHEKNPVACAAALATIKFIEEHDILDHVINTGNFAMQRLLALKARYPIIYDVRGRGLLIGLELRRDGKKAVVEAEQVMYCALQRGLNFKITMGNIITLTPPLTITWEEMKEALDILEESFASIFQISDKTSN